MLHCASSHRVRVRLCWFLCVVASGQNSSLFDPAVTPLATVARKPAVERARGKPRFVRTRRVPATCDQGRRDAFAADTGNALNVEDRERHAGYCSGQRRDYAWAAALHYFPQQGILRNQADLLFWFPQNSGKLCGKAGLRARKTRWSRGLWHSAQKCSNPFGTRAGTRYPSIVSLIRSVITAGSSARSNVTVRSKPSGPVIITRTPPRRGSAAIQAS